MTILKFAKDQTDTMVEFLTELGVFVQSIHRYEEYDEVLVNNEHGKVAVVNVELAQMEM